MINVCFIIEIFDFFSSSDYWSNAGILIRCNDP